MGRIKKAAGPKHEATVSPAVLDFVRTGCSLPVSRLVGHLTSFPQGWAFPRGDLYHWIPLLNRFDAILEAFNIEYGLNLGPQTKPFGQMILKKGVAEEGKSSIVTPTDQNDLDAIGYEPDGDCKLIEVILKHCQTLLENCGNRSLYSSSERLGELLNTTNLSLLSTTLQISVRLAQRYYTSRQRVANASQHMNHALLASHYNIDLEKVQKLANPFIKTASSHAATPATTETTNGMEKAFPQQQNQTTMNGNDLLALIQGTPATTTRDGKRASISAGRGYEDESLESWGGVHLTYYQPSISAARDDQKPPTTPTPARRASGLSHPARLSSSEDSTESPATSGNAKSDETSASGMKHVEISSHTIATTSVENIIRDHVENLPKESTYDLLARVRTAKAISGSSSTRQEAVGIRLLAITNLAYIYPETIFQQKILQPDSEEPRRLQLVNQLTTILNPPGNGESGISAKLQAVALGTLEAFSKHKAKEADVCAALSINVNHGVLFYVLRKAVAELAEDTAEVDIENDERREAIFSLVEDLPRPQHNRAGETLVAAGLLEILIEALNLRTRRAERTFPRILAIIHKVIFTPREGLQTFANAKGLDAISDLIACEVQSGLEHAQKGQGLPKQFRNQMIDYQIPFHQRETLTKLFRNISSMMQNSTGNFDRLLRNFIDSPPLLGGLRTTILNAKVFGAAIWSGAVNIMSSFIHNEPTSYAIIAESGLSKGLLEAISGRPIVTAEENKERAASEPSGTASAASSNGAPATSATAGPTSQHDLIVNELAKKNKTVRDSDHVMAQGILPHVEALLAIPQAFGAICLNNSGKDLFLASTALERFFEIFESLEHVKAMNNNAVDYDTPRILGSAFDELVRHHPDLRAPVLASVMNMVARVTRTCETLGQAGGCGAKLWIPGDNGQIIPAGDQGTNGKVHDGQDEDVVMGEASPSSAASSSAPALQRPSSSEKGAIDDDKEGANISLIIEIAMRFLAGLFENSGLCSTFVEFHGAGTILELATMPYLQYDFNNHSASQEIAKVVHMLAEQKPHLVLPDLLRRAQEAADTLRPLTRYEGKDGFFTEFTTPAQYERGSSKAAVGTTIVRNLVNVHTLCNILYEVFSPPILNPRLSSSTPFTQVNLADIYQPLIINLGWLHQVCVWEEILLQKRLPDSWKEATRIKGYGMGSEEADEVFGFINNEEDNMDDLTATPGNAIAGDVNGHATPPDAPKLTRKTPMSKDEGTAQFKNARTLRYLLSQLPSCIVPFFQSLAKALVNKRRSESYLRQNAQHVATTMANTLVYQLNFEPPEKSESAKDRYAYWIVILTSISQLVIEGSMERPHPQVLTLILQAFKDSGGLRTIQDILKVFYDEVKSYDSVSEAVSGANDKAAQLTSAYGGIKIILSFYTQITTSKSIIDSTQSQAIASTDRDRAHAHFFEPQQFLVELRLAVLPDVRLLWGSDFVDKASTSIIKCLIEILTTILEGADEQVAFKRGEDLPPKRLAPQKIYNINNEKIRFLTDKGFERELAKEALYRCMNTQNTALEYCQHLGGDPPVMRLPIPSYDYQEDRPARSQNPTPQRSESVAASEIPPAAHPSANLDESSVTDQDTTDAADGLFLLAQGGHDANNTTDPLGLPSIGVEVQETDGDEVLPGLMPPPPAPYFPTEDADPPADGMQMSIDNLDNLLGLAPAMLEQAQQALESHLTPDQARSSGPSPSGSRVSSRANAPEASAEAPKGPAPVTVNDLNNERVDVKAKLVERVLDVLNVHDDITFELAALIGAAAMKENDDISTRVEIGETLIQALISFSPSMGMEDFRASGKKISANAHLLGIVLQEEKFFQASLDCLKDNLEHLISFIKVFPDQAADQSSPWIASILLVVEKVLGEDVQPAQVHWNPPPVDQPVKSDDNTVVIDPPLLPYEDKRLLFGALLDIMPRIGKDESLVLSVVRILVILTRNRILAAALSDKRNIQRLFLMIKQLSGMTNDMLPGTFMILLRHIVEDEDTIRQIMRSEIAANFDTRSNRSTDTIGYIRQMHHLVLRSPEIFVDVTNEKLEIAKYDKDQRNQTLSLKPRPKEEKPSEDASREEKAEADRITGTKTGDELKQASGEEAVVAPQEGKTPTIKAPVVDQPSGVVHYLLTELLAYKDVEDKDPTPSPATKPPPEVISSPAAANSSTPTDAILSSSTSDPAQPSNDLTETKKPEKPEFKLEQHPIYIYRCFIIQCLTELLQSYNRIKIEFINFSRKADPKAMTPSKPRSGVLNYLLNDVIPVGTLNHEDSITFRKRTNTSNWAISAIVALCLRTNEAGYEKKAGSVDEDDQSDLLFVRKFVLEHALKAYQAAIVADEHPDIKYARLLDTADLFQRLLMGRLVAPGGPTAQTTEIGQQKSIAKLMYEKNFIATLTSSIADIDLNFPGSKRAIKYILRPLKQLTATAITLSQESDISTTPGTTDEDEISTASSVSDVADEREETPDLFRNSTLDMFEPGREDESRSGSEEEEDDEMYDEEEEDGMEYEEEMEPRDHDEVISDEEEEMGGVGHMEGLHGDTGMDVEVVIDGDEDDGEDDDDDDEDPDDSEDDDMDDDGDVEVLDEITGDNEGASLAEGDDEDWEEDMDGGEGVEDFGVEGEDIAGDAESAVRDIIQEFGGGGPNRGAGALARLEGGLQALEGLEDGPSDLQMDINNGRYMDDVIHREEEEDDEEDEEDREEDVDEEEEVIYHPDYDEDESAMPDPPWGFDPDDDPFAQDHHHHHHHHRHIPRRFQDGWLPFPGGTTGTRTTMPLYRSHRPAGGVARPNDDGANPLLRRNDRNASSRFPRSGLSDAAANLSDYWVHGMDMSGAPRSIMADSPVSFVNSIIAAIGNGTSAIAPIGANGAIHLQIGGPGRGAINGSQRELPRELQTLLGGRPMHHHEPMHIGRDPQPSPAVILPAPTFQRWQEEARLLYSTSANDKAMRVLSDILMLLVPPAIEKKRRETETTKRLQEQQEKLKEEQRVAVEKAEQEEREKREKEEQEASERVAQEAAEAAASAEVEVNSGLDNEEADEEATEAIGAEDGAMEGVESTQAEASTSTEVGEAPAIAEPQDGEPLQPAERVMTRLGDREIDITGLGIDLAYLDALPEDIRQEVLMSQIAIQRSEAAAAGEPPTEISSEFLEALPAEIRAELLQQESQDRRRREREEARRANATAAGGAAPRAEDMDPASFLASLDPTLRQHVLMEQDEDMLAHLPPEIAAEARALGGDRAMQRFAGMPGRGPRGLARQLLDARTDARRPLSIKKPPRKQVVQMLDKAGVATLLRLMFVPQQGSSRESYNAILRHISENRQNRSEVISLLLSILQDGSIDVSAVERSFTQLSIRAKQPVAQKTPQPLKRTLTGPVATVLNSVEATPLTVIQQCLSTLVTLTQHNPHIPSFFLTEHDLSSSMKSKSSRKGKSKETKAQKYPLNALLSLLGRKLIMESSGCLEQLASLLQSVTHPLNMLLKKEKEGAEEKEGPKPAEPSTEQQGMDPAATGPTEVDMAQNTSEPVEAPTASPMTDVQSTGGADQLAAHEGASAAASDPTPEDIAQTAETKDAEHEAAEDKKVKKLRALTPPLVPEENLRLVVSIIAARECSKRTFQQTVATISNLKAIPGAKEVFGKGLIEQAQDLGQAILEDLDELLPQIKQAESGTDIQGLALTKFATASSDQSKLLRVLTALDYLFGPKPEDKKASDKDKDTEVLKEDDLLTSLYENSTFGPLWDKLSECLSAIRQGEGMLNIASILQPLIEALMVVCKNTTLKDSPLVKAQKEFAVTSPAPESRMESLFFNFTEEHRKILNELVRHSPKLMMGTFSLLVKNPKVLEFDNKRSYFTRRLHSRGTEARHPQPPLQLSVRRDQVFLDSFKFLSLKTRDEIRYGKLSIRFLGEEGVDAGGVTREWFQVLSRQMFNPDYALFIPVASDRTTFHPNKLSKVNEEHLMFFKFIGRIIGKALYEGRALDCHFSRAVYKRILGKTVSIKDMETLDLEYYKSLLWMLENDITDVITETFSVETDDFGVTEVVDLVENGRNVPVTEENKQEYVQLVVEYRLTGSVQTQLAKFLEGFHDIVPPELISIFNEQELELLISGLPDIDVDDWKNHTEYHNYQAASPQIQWFWRAVRSFDKEERAKLLQFVTGTSKVPLNGFGQLEGMNGFSRFNIHRDYGHKDRLPSSHTCFNQLDLPEYDSYESLRSHVYTAITAGSQYFGFA